MRRKLLLLNKKAAAIPKKRLNKLINSIVISKPLESQNELRVFYNLILYDGSTEISDINFNSIIEKGLTVSALLSELENLIDQDLLLINDWSKGKGSDFRALKIFDIRRRVLILDILAYKGFREITINEIEDLLVELKNLEAFEEYVQLLEKKIGFLTLIKWNSEIETSKIELSFARKTLEQVTRSKSLYISAVEACNYSFAVPAFNTSLTSIIKEQTYLSEQSKSPFICYYKSMCEFLYFEMNGNHLAAISSLNEIRDLLECNDYLSSNNRWQQFELNSAHLFLKLLDSRLADKHLVNCKNLASTSISEIAICYLTAIRTLYFESDENELISIANELKNKLQRSTDNFKYRLGSVLVSYYFLNHEFDQLILLSSELKADNRVFSKYSYYIKLLLILAYIQKQDYDSADLAIENFRKLIERQADQTRVYPRLILIKQVLLKLKSLSFNFNRSNFKQFETQYKSLISDGLYVWHPAEIEIIPFHNWLECMFNKGGYGRKFFLEFLQLKINEKVALTSTVRPPWQT